MSVSFNAYFEKLERLSTEALDRSARELALEEKRNTALVIAHIAEIARRKGELEQGYPSLFEYCLRRLGLSEGSVALRIQVANVARKFPQVLVALSKGRISLSVAGRLAPHLRPDSVDRLLQDTAGMTKREVEEYLVALDPKPVLEPSIRKRPQERNTAPTEEKQEIAPPAEKATPTPPELPQGRCEPARPEVFNFRFSAERAFREKLLRLGEVLGIGNPEGRMADVLERALDLALEKKDPKERAQRRFEREQKRALESSEKARPDEEEKPGLGASDGQAPAPGPGGRDAAREMPVAIAPDRPPETNAGSPAKSRYIPLEVRDRVFQRAGHRCEFTGPQGTRCSARTGLQIEHLKPFAIHGSHEEAWLRAYCPRHNRFSAERVYGATLIQLKIEEASLRKCTATSQRPIEVQAIC